MRIKLHPSFKNPIIQFTGILGFLALGALYFNPRMEVLAHAGLIFGFLLTWAIFIAWGMGVKKNIWNSVIEALILFLLMRPPTVLDLEAIWLIAGTTLAVVASRFVILYKNQVIFNPVVIGLLVATSFGVLTSWWGTTFGGGASVIFVGLLLAFSVWKIKKIWLGASFLLGNLILMYFFGEAESIHYVYTDSTIYFFAGIMLMEPKTSPRKIPAQIFCGILAALFYRTAAYMDVPDTELWTILMVNGLNFIDKKFKIFKFLDKK